MEFGRQYSLNATGVMLNGDGVVYETTKSICVHMTEVIDDMICSEIVKAATEQGITDLIILDKTTILKTLRKATPMTVENSICPECGWYKIYFGDDYCRKCGQRLEWE